MLGNLLKYAQKKIHRAYNLSDNKLLNFCMLFYSPFSRRKMFKFENNKNTSTC